MKKTLTTIAITALALFVPTALAVPPATSPAKQCRQLQQTMSPADFASAMNATANPKSAFGKCVSTRTQQAAHNTANAAKACKAEMADPAFASSHENKSFAEWYGKNENDRNAFGKCVSAKAKEAAADQQQAVLNAAKTCKTMRTTDLAGFEQAYGTKKNAFGKCVSKNAKEK